MLPPPDGQPSAAPEPLADPSDGKANPTQSTQIAYVSGDESSLSAASTMSKPVINKPSCVGKYTPLYETPKILSWHNQPSKQHCRCSPHRSLTEAQRNVVKIAQSNLTQAQCELIDKQIEMMQQGAQCMNCSQSPEVGPSQDKGKGIDPHNWGAAGIPYEELDIDAQRAVFDQLMHHRRTIVDNGHDA